MDKLLKGGQKKIQASTGFECAPQRYQIRTPILIKTHTLC